MSLSPALLKTRLLQLGIINHLNAACFVDILFNAIVFLVSHCTGSELDHLQVAGLSVSGISFGNRVTHCQFTLLFH